MIDTMVSIVLDFFMSLTWLLLQKLSALTENQFSLRETRKKLEDSFCKSGSGHKGKK